MNFVKNYNYGFDHISHARRIFCIEFFSQVIIVKISPI